MDEELNGYEVGGVFANGLSQLVAERPHTLIFAAAAMVLVILTANADGGGRDLSAQRKWFWATTLGAAFTAFIAGLPDVAAGAGLALIVVMLQTILAYFSTQYLKIGHRVVAFDSAERLPRDGQTVPYGSRTTATKTWWIVVACLAGGSVIVLGYVMDSDISWAGVVWLGLCLVLPFTLGFLDGTDRQRVARGQYLQFAVITVISAGVFSVLYSVAYTVALRRSAASR